MSLNDIARIQQSIAGSAQLGLNLNSSSSGAGNSSNAPWNEMPDGGFPFPVGATLNTPAVGTGWVDVIGPATVPNLIVPNGYDGVIRHLVNSYNGGGFINGSGSLLWRILRNGQAVRGYDSIRVLLGGDSVTGSTLIRIGSGDSLQFQVNNISLIGGGTQIFCYLGGWFYPQKASL